MKNSEKSMDRIVALCKSRGFIYSGSEIYGGLANSWDYGPLGVEIKQNLKRAWWKKFVQESEYNVGIDSAILMNSEVWKASGHVGGFSDPLVDCKSCKSRFRADQLIDCVLFEECSVVNDEEISNLFKEGRVSCPNCGETSFTDIRSFNLMFKTFQGVVDDCKSELYLRPETAQGIFVNFANVQRTARKKLPFGICQMGKSFRNEITPGNFIFRTREFEQMELEFFCKPGQDLEWFEYWKNFCRNFLISIGISEGSLRFRNHDSSELAHYSRATSDLEFQFPFGFGELWGISDRADFDLKQHQVSSGKSLEYFDPETGSSYLPFCVEPSLGVDRAILALLCDAYDEEKLDRETRTVLRLSNFLAPFKACVLPLSKKLSEGAIKVKNILSKYFMVDYDESGSIGKRYRRQDEIGTPFCITYDFDSVSDCCVTVRDRDSMQQASGRIAIDRLKNYLEDRLAF